VVTPSAALAVEGLIWINAPLALCALDYAATPFEARLPSRNLGHPRADRLAILTEHVCCQNRQRGARDCHHVLALFGGSNSLACEFAATNVAKLMEGLRDELGRKLYTQQQQQSEVTNHGCTGGVFETATRGRHIRFQSQVQTKPK
jgi:hypothetical protein